MPASYTLASCDPKVPRDKLASTDHGTPGQPCQCFAYPLVRGNCSLSYIEMVHDSMLLTTDSETSSIIINVVYPIWTNVVTSFKYLRAGFDDRSQISRAGNVD